jgi:opacity protein-like surface antigen
MSFGKNLSGRAMNARSKHLLRAGLIALVSLSLASIVLPASAADLPPPPPAPVWTWSGLYVGGQIGGVGGSATLSDPQGPSIFGDKVNTSGFLAGLQLGYDWRFNSRWVIGVVADANHLDGKGTFTCMQASPTLLGSNCEVDPRVLATVAGRLGYVLDPLGRTLIYGKIGGAWTNSEVTLTPNNNPDVLSGFRGYIAPGSETNTSAGAWGGMVGVGLEHALTPAWSVGLEYDYYRFAAANVTTPSTVNLTRNTAPLFTNVASSTSGVTQDMQIVKLALNYHFGNDPWAASLDAPVFAIGAFPTKAPTISVWNGWQLDAGGRYWYSTGSSTNTSGAGSIVSRLPYTNLTGQSGEFFARIDTPSLVFVKGFVGAGAITGGKMNDEDWALSEGMRPNNVATAYEVTGSSASGWLKYGVGDIGYSIFHGGNYKVGPFVGYSYFHQTMNGFGCTQLTTPGSVCDPPFPSNQPGISQDDTWQALRVGASAIVTVWDRLAVNGDVAYLPYAQFSGLDSHWQRQPITFFPQSGTGRGIQTELILTYAITDHLNVGVGGRYWAMWSAGANQGCHGDCGASSVSPPSPFTTNTQRYGTFVQASYRFNALP